MSKQEIRKKIDDLDWRILELLSERAGLAKETAKFKKNFYDPAREKAVFERLEEINPGPLKAEHVHAIWREVMSACRSLQRPATVAFLGPRATFSHSAAIQQFGTSITEMPCPDIAEVFDNVEKDNADYGVVPFENSSEGVINYTLDRFALSPIRVCGEIYCDVALNLISKQESLTKIKRIYSHPKAIEQCTQWIKSNAQGVTVTPLDSTAQAAQKAAKSLDSAAIASSLAAEIYGLKVVRQRIEDHKNNMTRFLVIGKEKMPPTGSDKTSVLFSVRHAAGSLYRALKPFEKYKLNLTMMQARPSRTGQWEYVFFVDLEGHETDKSVADAINEMRKETIILKTMGSYPVAAKE